MQNGATILEPQRILQTIPMQL